MNNSASDDGGGDGTAPPHPGTAGPNSNGIINIRERVRVELSNGERERSPTPPRALFRSTTGKGVAFTDEDIAFLIKLLHHKKKSVERLVDPMEPVNPFAQISGQTRYGCVLEGYRTEGLSSVLEQYLALTSCRHRTTRELLG